MTIDNFKRPLKWVNSKWNLLKPAQEQQQQQAMDISLSRKTHRVQFCAKDRGEVLLLLRGRLLLPQRCLKQHSFYSAHFIASLSKAIKTYSLIFCKKIRDFSSAAQFTSVCIELAKTRSFYSVISDTPQIMRRVSHRCFYEGLFISLGIRPLKMARPSLCSACLLLELLALSSWNALWCI